MEYWAALALALALYILGICHPAAAKKNPQNSLYCALTTRYTTHIFLTCAARRSWTGSFLTCFSRDSQLVNYIGRVNWGLNGTRIMGHVGSAF